MTETLPIDSLMIDRWTNQWMKQLGFNNEQLTKRSTKVEEFTRFVIDRIQTKKSTDIIKREQLLIETLREYEHRLSRTGFENDISEEFETMKLKQKEILIEKKHQELDLREEKSVRELDQLSQNERNLCHILAELPMEIITDQSLVKRIERLQDYLNTLETIKNKRLTIVQSHRTRLLTLCTQLDYQSSIISPLLDEKYESCLTTDSISQMESFLKELECKFEEQGKRVNTLVGKLEKLYAKLARDDAPLPKCSAAYILRHNTAETVKQLEDEIAELQAQRMATSQEYCQSMHKKIEELYEQCQIGISERHPIDFENITPETLDECDREYDRLHDMYRARKLVLDTFEQWKLLAQQHAEFQKKSTSAARFHERGYSAVKEQAERKRFAIALPKAERAVFNALEQWENEHVNEQFLINDIPIRQIVEQQHPTTSNLTTTTISKTVSMPTISSITVPHRTTSKANIRKKSLRNIMKPPVEQQVTKSRHEVADEDTLEFTQLENVKHINGLPRFVTSTPKTGKTNASHTVIDTGRNKTNDPIHKRRPSKRMIPSRR